MRSWLVEYAKLNGIDLERLTLRLFSKPLPAAESRALIVTDRFVNGDWTYVSSSWVRIHDLLRVRIDGRAAVLVLYQRAAPGELVAALGGRWNLALFSEQLTRLADVPFQARIPHDDPGLWDVINASLGLAGQRVAAKVGYGHAGGGGPRDQEFQATFAVRPAPGWLALTSAKQTIDRYP